MQNITSPMLQNVTKSFGEACSDTQNSQQLKSCVHYSFTSLFCMSKRDHL